MKTFHRIGGVDKPPDLFRILEIGCQYNVHVKQDKEFINLNEPDIIKDRNCRERRFIEYGKEKSVFTRI